MKLRGRSASPNPGTDTEPVAQLDRAVNGVAHRHRLRVRSALARQRGGKIDDVAHQIWAGIAANVASKPPPEWPTSTSPSRISAPTVRSQHHAA
jgi:hypothetical protein